MTHKFRYDDGFWPNLAALVYVGLTYFGGLALLVLGPIWLWLPATVALAHGMVIAAYLIHECAHNTIFADGATNTRWGRWLSWVTGASYGGYQEMRAKHIRHHVDRADVVSFDYRRYLRERPWLLRLTKRLEWAYIPAVDLLMHAFVIAAPFTHATYRHNRARVSVNLGLRMTGLTLLGLWAPQALAGYIVAYLLFISVLRLMDMHQHTFDLFVLPEADARPPHRPDATYEQQNTYSNLLGQSALANLLVLNFGFHNAHHIKPNAPWYRLPKLHRELFGDPDKRPELSAADLFRSYHRHRVARVMSAQPGDTLTGGANGRGADFVGVYGVSFLTAL